MISQPDWAINLAKYDMESNPKLSRIAMPTGIPQDVQIILQSVYFKKDSFADHLQLPEIPTNSYDPSWSLKDEITIVHDTFERFKLKDEVAIAVLTENDKKLTDLGLMLTPQLEEEVLARELEIRTKISKLLIRQSREKELINRNKPVVANIARQLKEVDETYVRNGKPIPGSSKWDEWARMRIKLFTGGILDNTDADLTLTGSVDYLSLLPAHRFLENLMNKNSRSWFIVGFARYSREALEVLPNVFRTIGERISFRPGVYEFYAETAALGDSFKPVIVSANFGPIIEGMTARLAKYQRKIGIMAITPEDISATVKSSKTLRLAIEHPNRAQIVKADGETDGDMLTNSDSRSVIACVFALQGSKFEELAQSYELPYFPFRDFDDVRNHYRRLKIY